MDFDSYLNRILMFGLVFETIFKANEDIDENLNLFLPPFSLSPALNSSKDIHIIKTMMKGVSIDFSNRPKMIVKFKNDTIMGLKSYQELNFALDAESLADQAEKLKSDIMNIGIKVRSKLRENISNKFNIFTTTDFIRNDDGCIVYPFDYWYDCVVVYMIKNVEQRSNDYIARNYAFKSSRSSTHRARLHLVANALNECEHLKSAVLNNEFPPMILSGTKQPSMKHRNNIGGDKPTNLEIS